MAVLTCSWTNLSNAIFIELWNYSKNHLVDKDPSAEMWHLNQPSYKNLFILKNETGSRLYNSIVIFKKWATPTTNICLVESFRLEGR